MTPEYQLGCAKLSHSTSTRLERRLNTGLERHFHHAKTLTRRRGPSLLCPSPEPPAMRCLGIRSSRSLWQWRDHARCLTRRFLKSTCRNGGTLLASASEESD
eukprot:2647377-Rhodomonas_salina.5